MPDRRWICASLLLVAAGVLTAAASARHWAPCRSAPLGTDCTALQRGAHGFPGWESTPVDPVATTEVVIAAVLLLLAWVLATGWHGDGWAHRVMVMVVGAQPLLAAALAAHALVDPGRPLPPAVGGWLTWPAEAYIFPLLLGAGWLLNAPPATVLRLMALGWAVTSFGSVHHFGDYVLARMVSPASAAGTPDAVITTPPGLGYATAALQVLVGLVLLISFARRDRRGGDERPRRGDHTLAA